MAIASKMDEKDEAVKATLSPTTSVQEGMVKEQWNKDEYTLAQLGYKQGELINDLI